MRANELRLLNCGVGEDSWESIGLQGDQISQSWRKSTLNIHWKNYAAADAPILWAPDAKSQSAGKTLKLRKIEGGRRRGQQRMRCLGSITDSMDMNLSKLWEIVKDRDAWHAAVHGAAKSGAWLSDWPTRGSKSPDATTSFPGGSGGKESPCNAGDTADLGLITGSERSPGVGNSTPLQYSCLENPMDRGAWWATVCGFPKSQKDWATNTLCHNQEFTYCN